MLEPNTWTRLFCCLAWSSLWACTAASTPQPNPSPTAPARCALRGPLPDPSCTPGAVETTDLEIICHHSTWERRNVSSAIHRQVFEEYGMAYPQTRGEFEVDHLIPLELGGSNDIANLWPEAAEPRPGFHDKDLCENWAHKIVCDGTMAHRRGAEANGDRLANHLSTRALMTKSLPPYGLSVERRQ
jgi:hypothetical protein